MIAQLAGRTLRLLFRIDSCCWVIKNSEMRTTIRKIREEKKGYPKRQAPFEFNGKKYVGTVKIITLPSTYLILMWKHQTLKSEKDS